jgi:hypothetical protein
MFARAKKNHSKRHPANAGCQFIAPSWTWGFWTTCSRADNQVEFSRKSRKVPTAIHGDWMTSVFGTKLTCRRSCGMSAIGVNRTPWVHRRIDANDPERNFLPNTLCVPCYDLSAEFWQLTKAQSRRRDLSAAGGRGGEQGTGNVIGDFSGIGSNR